MNLEVIKVQVPLLHQTPNPQALIYNEQRTLLIETPLDDEIKSLMGDSMKKYFHAEVVDGVIEVIDEAVEQDW